MPAGRHAPPALLPSTRPTRPGRGAAAWTGDDGSVRGRGGRGGGCRCHGGGHGRRYRCMKGSPYHSSKNRSRSRGGTAGTKVTTGRPMSAPCSRRSRRCPDGASYSSRSAGIQPRWPCQSTLQHDQSSRQPRTQTAMFPGTTAIPAWAAPGPVCRPASVVVQTVRGCASAGDTARHRPMQGRLMRSRPPIDVRGTAVPFMWMVRARIQAAMPL